MGNHKDILKQAMNELPAGFAELLETAVMPAAGEITMPASVEEALMACGKAARYLNAIFASMAGLPLLQVPLRIGQLNPSTQIMAAAGLQFVGSELHDLKITSPLNETYVQSGADVYFACEVQGSDDVVEVTFEAVSFPMDAGALVRGSLASDGSNIFSRVFGVLGDGRWGIRFKARYMIDEKAYTTGDTTFFTVGNPS